VNDAVEALQVKVGADSSAVTSSLDYKVADHASRLTTLEGASGGKILQVLQTTKLDVFSTTSSTYTDLTGLSVSITPSSASSKVLVMMQISVGHSTVGSADRITLVRDSTAIFEGTNGTDNGTIAWNNQDAFSSNSTIPLTVVYLDSPATTSATTYKAQLKTSVGTLYVNRSGAGGNSCGTCSITVMEVSA
jgi:glycine cleavage system regulatory protein